MRLLLTLLSAIMVTSQLFAQVGATATIKNMHLWRGGEVADGLVVTTDVHYTVANESVRFGFWGGANIVGEYKEFNNYVSYTHGGLSITLSDTYNFSEYATYNNSEFFNYTPSQTGRFLDATMVYKFDGDFPLSLSWATVLFGRDRDADNHHNRYSTYCSVTYSLFRKNRCQIDASISSAFAINNVDHSVNFYGDKAGVVEVSLKMLYVITISDYNIPMSTTAMWNPQSNEGYLELSAQVVTF